MQYKVGDKVRAIRQAPSGHFQIEVGKIYTIKNVLFTTSGYNISVTSATPKDDVDFYPAGYGNFSDKLFTHVRIRTLPAWF